MNATTLLGEGATTTTWQIDPQHTQVEFEVNHMMFAKVKGRFDALEGSIQLRSGDDFGAGRVEVSIASASINTGQEQRDDHLRSPDFFDVAQFPELTFKSRTVQPRGNGEFTVTGDLSVRGVTREVVLDVAESGRGTDPWANTRVAFNATTTLDRRDFGLTWNQALEAGGILVGHEVRVTLEIQAVLQAG